jgi:hypothetical protein
VRREKKINKLIKSYVDLSTKSDVVIQKMCVDSTLIGLRPFQPEVNCILPKNEANFPPIYAVQKSALSPPIKDDRELNQPPIINCSVESNQARMIVLLNSLVYAYADIFERFQ